MQIKCIVAATNPNREPDLYSIVIECTKSQYNSGKHYAAAWAQCEEDGYVAFLAYDENDAAGKMILPLFEWDSANVLSIIPANNRLTPKLQ